MNKIKQKKKQKDNFKFHIISWDYVKNYHFLSLSYHLPLSFWFK